MSREAVAVALWRTRLAWTRTRCLHVAESSLAAAERLGNVRRPGQQGDARIFCQRAQDALLAVAAIDQMTEASPRRAVRRNATTVLPGGSATTGHVTARPLRAVSPDLVDTHPANCSSDPLRLLTSYSVRYRRDLSQPHGAAAGQTRRPLSPVTEGDHNEIQVASWLRCRNGSAQPVSGLGSHRRRRCLPTDNRHRSSSVLQSVRMRRHERRHHCQPPFQSAADGGAEVG
jgi:hypothetical protein